MLMHGFTHPVKTGQPHSKIQVGSRQSTVGSRLPMRYEIQKYDKISSSHLCVMKGASCVVNLQYSSVTDAVYLVLVFNSSHELLLKNR